MDTYYKNWSLILSRLRSEYGNVAFESWLKHIHFIAFTDGILQLSTPTSTLHNWVQSEYLPRIKQLWMRQYPHTTDIEIDCIPPYASNDEIDTPIDNMTIMESVPTLAQPFAYVPNPHFVFDSFVVNDTNKMAFRAAQAIADGTATCNTLYIYGNVGLGKTHLLCAIADYMHRIHPDKMVIYLSAERFMNLFTESLRKGTIDTFKQTVRSADVLLVDDIHFIANKAGTQEEFFYTFKTLIEQQSYIVLSGNTPPSFLQNIDGRIISRVNGGVVAEIEKTDYALRCQILHTKARQMQHDIDDDTVKFISRRITNNTRDLEGALNRIVTYASFMEMPITEQVVCKILHDILSMDTKAITTLQIQETVAKYYNITVTDLESKSRKKAIVVPRQLAIYITKTQTEDSLSTIGRAFGGRDHTTILHAIRRIEDLLQHNISLQQDMQKITKILN